MAPETLPNGRETANFSASPGPRFLVMIGVKMTKLSPPTFRLSVPFSSGTMLLWYFVASISFRSTEAFAHYLHVPEATAALQSMPLLHLTKSQRGMIGEERVKDATDAQTP